jgi:hypothetical protein
VDLSLIVYDSVPGTPTPTTPGNGAVNVPVPVTFSWSTGTQAVSYDIEIATDAGFTTVVYTANVAGTSHAAEYGFDELTTYYWRVRAVNLCGSGTFSEIFSFTTEEIPPILLVDDDDNDPNTRPYYKQILDNLGLEYDIWNTNNTDAEPLLPDLASYEIVIWFTGGEFGGASGPSPLSETVLASWLENNNGCFFLSSQDYFYDRGLTPFMQNYLGVAGVTNDNGNYTSITGQGVLGGHGPYNLIYPFPDRSDILTPDGTASTAIVGNNSNVAALSKDNGSYKTTYWAVPFEAIPNPDNREDIMVAFLTWCSGGEPTPTPSPTATITPTVTSTPTGTPPPPIGDNPIYLPLIIR